MPSGAKKRKSSKRPKPKGESGPELEAGPEEAMEDKRLEEGDGTPSPRGIEGESEALAERGLEAQGINGEALKEGGDESEAPYKDLPTDEAAVDQVDPPSQAYPDSEIPASIKPEALVEIEPNEKPVQEERELHAMEEPAQNETETHVDPALRDDESKVNPFVEDMKPATELDDMPTDSEPAIDATSATSANEVKPDADDGLDGVQSSVESAMVERGSVDEAGPIGNEPGTDEYPADMETKTDAPSDDLAPATNDVTHMDIPSEEVESDVREPPAEVKSESDAALNELQANNASEETPVEAEQERDGAPAEIKSEIDETQVEELGAAAPVDTKPDMEEASAMERELETHAALRIDDREDAPEEEPPLNGQPDAPADTAAETDYVGQGTDPSPDEIPPVIGTSLNENPPEADISPDEPPSEASVAEKERNETDLDDNAGKVDTEHNEASLAEIKVPPALESEMEALKDAVPEENLGGGETSVGTEATPELQLEPETVSRPEDLIEDTSLENLPETESEAKADAIEDARPEDEACVESKPEETGPVRSNVDGQDLVEEVEAVPDFEAEAEVETSPRGIELEGDKMDAQERETVETEPEPEIGTSHGMEVEAEKVDPEPVREVKTSPGIELGAEAVETEPEPAAEARVDLDGESGRSHCETQSGQLDLVQVEPDQSGDQQPDKQEPEEYVGELATPSTEVRQSLESEAQVADASDVPDKENECAAAISAFDEGNIVEDSISPESSSERSDHGEAEKTVIMPEPENGDAIPPAATALRGEGEGGVSHYNQESSVEDEQAKVAAGDIEDAAGDEIQDESKEDTNRQDTAVYAGHAEGEGVLAFGGSGDETEKASEQELATTELPLDAIAQSTKNLGDQERTVDVRHDEDGDVLGSAGKSAEAEEQELHSELPPAAAFSVEEPTEEGPPPSDPEQFTEQHHSIDEDDGIVPGDEHPRVESEQNLKATLPAESETFHSASAPQDKVVTQATDEKVESDCEFPLESACDEPEKDIGEEEAEEAESTVAEAGSVLNDFDERASCEQDLLSADFTAIDEDMDASDSKESDGDLETEASEYTRTGSKEQVHVESEEAAKPAETDHTALSEEASCDEQAALPQPEQAAQGSGQDSICSPKEEEAPGNKELKADWEEKATSEDDEVAGSPIPEPALPVFSGDEMVSKALEHLGNGQQSMSNSEGASREQRVENSANSKADGEEETEIHAMGTREFEEADLHKPMGFDAGSGADKPLVEPPPTSEGRDIEDAQAFRQETTKEAKQHDVVPTQDRSLEQVNMKTMEEQRPRGGTVAVEGRRKMLGCCGLFEALLGKN